MLTKFELLQLCSCPRTPDKNIAAPLCSVEPQFRHEHEQVLSSLFVNLPENLNCTMARRYSYGNFCIDEYRVQLFKETLHK